MNSGAEILKSILCSVKFSWAIISMSVAAQIQHVYLLFVPMLDVLFIIDWMFDVLYIIDWMFV